jgi:hypothetical protein
MKVGDSKRHDGTPGVPDKHHGRAAQMHQYCRNILYMGFKPIRRGEFSARTAAPEVGGDHPCRAGEALAEQMEFGVVESQSMESQNRHITLAP